MRLDTRTPQLVASTSTPTFVTSATFTYRIQLADSASTLVGEQVGITAGADGRVIWTIANNLDIDKTYKWRARAESGTAFGPWSAYRTFLTPNSPSAMPSSQTATTLWDNLTDGKTIGRPTNMEFTVASGTVRGGARTISFLSYIQYPLLQTLTQGEFSFYVDNFNPLALGGKTKFSSQSSDAADVTTDPWRFTLKKRGTSYSSPGQVRWRIITGDGANRVYDGGPWQPTLDKTKTHFVSTTWGNGRVTLLMAEADPTTGALGTQRLNVSGSYSGTYRPNPHMVYIGVEPGRAGEEDASVPNMTVRWVWVSDGNTARPGMRPADLMVTAGPSY